jgi:hypothetical protein
MWALHVEAEKRLGEEEVEATDGDNGKDGGRDKAVQQRRQHDHDQIEEGGGGEVETELKACPCHEGQGHAARDPQRDQVAQLPDEFSVHVRRWKQSRGTDSASKACPLSPPAMAATKDCLVVPRHRNTRLSCHGFLGPGA